MNKITKKQEQFLNLLINFYKVNNIFPTINDIKLLTNFKSYNSIYKYLNSLEKKNIITYDKKRKQITFINKNIKDNHSILVPFINDNDYFSFNDIDNNCFTLMVNDNNLKSFGVYPNDLLVIKKELTHLKNKFVMIKDNEKYKVYKYEKRGSFHYLINDKEELVFEDTNIIIGKVVSLLRNM